MKEAIESLAHYVALGVDGIAIVIVAAASIEATVQTVRRVAMRADTPQLRQVWIRYARWLAAALTFQLASDIVNTAISPSWEDTGRLAAIAAIRTFLTYFLDRDIEEGRRLERNERLEGYGDARSSS